MSASVVTIDSRLTDDSVDNVAERHTPETTPDKFSENVTSSHLSIAMPDGFRGKRLCDCWLCTICSINERIFSFSRISGPTYWTELGWQKAKDRRIAKVTIVPEERQLKYWDIPYPLIVPGCHTDQPSRVFKATTNKTQAKWITSPLSNAPATWVYSIDRYDINAEGDRADRHGITGWIFSHKPPASDQDIKLRFVNRDVVKAQLHRDEVLELEKGRHLKVKGNTGGWRPLRAQDNFYDWRREVMRREPRFVDEADSPTEMVWDGDAFTLVDDKPEYFACQIKERGRGRDKTDEKRSEDREEFEVKRADFEAKLRAGEGWSPLDPREDDRVLPNGVKVNLSNELVKRMEYEIGLHWQDYKTKQSLAEELGLKYETVRRIEMEDINKKKERPTTQFTAEQIKDIATHDGRVVYVHVEGLDKPRWYKLDMQKHETYREAIEEVRWAAQDEAFKKAKVPSRRTDKRTPQDHAELARALKEVFVRYELAFRPVNLYILDLRSPTVRAFAQIAWEDENGVPNTRTAP
jgi:hypothetical protein